MIGICLLLLAIMMCTVGIVVLREHDFLRVPIRISYGNPDLLRDGCLKCKQADYNVTVEKLRVPCRHEGISIKFYRKTLSKTL